MSKLPQQRTAVSPTYRRIPKVQGTMKRSINRGVPNLVKLFLGVPTLTTRANRTDGNGLMDLSRSACRIRVCRTAQWQRLSSE
jgi:hypothetical protein